ncbi:hypothetical protein B0H11DRAFT_2064589 [Mycena galericulata]|nr:hypothetical protein B0H11DRAFT_2064589 [Mycena galericulata]
MGMLSPLSILLYPRPSPLAACDDPLHRTPMTRRNVIVPQPGRNHVICVPELFHVSSNWTSIAWDVDFGVRTHLKSPTYK